MKVLLTIYPDRNIMQLKIVPHEESIFTIQKSCLSTWTSFEAEHPNYSNQDGKYALVSVSDNARCVCKLLFQREIHPAFVYLDDSVIHFKADRSCTLPQVPLSLKNGYIQVGQIEILPQVVTVKSVDVTVILESISDIKKWKRNQEKLQHTVHEILKLYVFTKDCVVSLRNLKEGLRHGIHAIVIHHASQCKSGIVPGQVTSGTHVTVSGIASKLRFEQQQSCAGVTKLGGLEEPIKLLKEIISSNVHHKNMKDVCLKPTKQVLLTGPPGCGKTSLVRLVASESRATLLSVLGPEMVASKPGATEEALRKIFDDAAVLASEDRKSVCILLLDEIDTLCSRRNPSNSSSHSVRANVQLLSLLEEADKIPGLIIMATTSKLNLLDPSVRRPGRLETEVFIGVPTEQAREHILNILLEPMKPPNVSALARIVASLTPGYVGGDLVLLCQEVAMSRHHQSRKDVSAVDNYGFESWLVDFHKAIGKVKPSALRSGLGVVMTTPTSMDSIAGLKNIKSELTVAVEWPLVHPEAYARMGLPPPKGVLLYGPPGCAKTSIARALATSTNTTFLSVSAADLYSPYVGEAERSIAELFQRARSGAPSILFIDEIDALVGCRGDRERGVQERILSALLTEMDGVGIRLEAPTPDQDQRQLKEGDSSDECFKEFPKKKVSNTGIIVIAATNRPDMLDDALLRPGRFDKHLYIPAPDVDERLDILQCVTMQMPLATCVNLPSIATHTHLFSGADLSHLCKEAALCALTQDGMNASEIKQCHFESVLEKLRPSLSAEQITWYDNYKAGK